MIRFVVAALASINVAGFLGLAWFAYKVVFHDGLMWVELAICAVPMAVLALATWGGLALRRRGHAGVAIALLAVAALPTLAAFGFLLYLDRNPIDWR